MCSSYEVCTFDGTALAAAIAEATAALPLNGGTRSGALTPRTLLQSIVVNVAGIPLTLTPSFALAGDATVKWDAGLGEAGILGQSITASASASTSLALGANIAALSYGTNVANEDTGKGAAKSMFLAELSPDSGVQPPAFSVNTPRWPPLPSVAVDASIRVGVTATAGLRLWNTGGVDAAFSAWAEAALATGTLEAGASSKTPASKAKCAKRDAFWSLRFGSALDFSSQAVYANDVLKLTRRIEAHSG